MSLSRACIESDDDVSPQTLIKKFELVIPAGGNRSVGIEGCGLLFIVLHRGITLDVMRLSASDCRKWVAEEVRKVWQGSAADFIQLEKCGWVTKFEDQAQGDMWMPRST